MKCNTCKWWSRFEDETGYGDCRLATPTIKDYMQCEYVNRGVWPVTHGDEWCGKFNEREINAHV